MGRREWIKLKIHSQNLSSERRNVTGSTETWLSVLDHDNGNVASTKIVSNVFADPVENAKPGFC